MTLPATAKLGCVLLSLWSGLNLVVGAAVTIGLLLGHDAPALAYAFRADEVRALDPRAVDVVNGLAHLANPPISEVTS